MLAPDTHVQIVGSSMFSNLLREAFRPFKEGVSRTRPLVYLVSKNLVHLCMSDQLTLV